MSHYPVYPTYDLMVRKTAVQPAYRGTPDRYPLGDRRNTRHYFIKHEVDGQTVFDICYDYRFIRVDISKAEHDEIQAKGGSSYDHNGEYFRYERGYNPIVRILPDDTIEFVANGLHQGDRMFLANQVLNGYVFNDSRRGGVMFRSNDRKILAPIYKGLRVDRNFKPTSEVTVTTYKVDRKKSKALVKDYEDCFKVAEVMFASLTDKDSFAQAVHDIAKDHLTAIEGSKYNDSRVREIAVSLMNTAPLDAFVLNGIYHDVSHFRFISTQGKYPPWNHGSFDPAGFYSTIKRKMLTALYQESPEVFKPETRQFGEHFAPTTWGVDIMENGKEVAQYGYSAS